MQKNRIHLNYGEKQISEYLKILKQNFVNYNYFDQDFLLEVKNLMSTFDTQEVCRSLFTLIQGEEKQMPQDVIIFKLEKVFGDNCIPNQKMDNSVHQIHPNKIHQTVLGIYKNYERLLKKRGDIAHPLDEVFQDKLENLAFSPENQEIIDRLITQIKVKVNARISRDYFISNENGEKSYYYYQ